MPSCVVHVDNRADPLARGMSWPVRSIDVAAAFESRIDPQIWFEVSRCDEIKQWSKRSAIERFHHDVVLVKAFYELRWVTWSAARCADRLTPPAWVDLDPPPLVNCCIRSIPAGVMRDATLTKTIVAAELMDAIRTMCPSDKPITAHDWRVTRRLDSQKKRLFKRFEHKPVSRWEIVRESAVSLDPDRRDPDR
jgi:hypothetical protein